MSDTFKHFVQDQLRGMAGLELRRMFGGYGLYCGAIFFGIIHQGRLYFKTTEVTRGIYQSRGMQPFRPGPKQTLRSYYEVPADVVENADELCAWAGAALSIDGTGE